MNQFMSLLGMKVVDKVTGFKGVVSSISFDLYGCIQAVVTPPSTGERLKGSWFDVQRLRVTGKKPVMKLPDYNAGYIASGKKGPAEKPEFE